VTAIGETFRSSLTANAGVTALVSGRIFPQVIPQGCTMPAIRYLVVDDLPLNSVDGFTSHLRIARVQADAYARTYLAAHAVADAIEGALRSVVGPDFAALVVSRRDGYEDETELHRVILDVSVAVGT
jgi:selenocysteine-specific translation elongation factor